MAALRAEMEKIRLFMDIKGTTIGFLSPRPLEDKFSLSGTMHCMANAIESTGARVVWVPVKTSTLPYKLYLKAVKETLRIFPAFKDKLPRCLMWKSRITARKLDKDLVESCDVIFAPMQSGAVFFLETDMPVIYLSDATFHNMIDYYWFNLPRKDIEEGELIEKTAMDKAAALFYPSHWVAESAVRDYGQSWSKIKIAPFGPNFDPGPIEPHAFRFDGHLDILFVGVDWKRKGGQIAVDACKWLNDNGIDSTLHLVGIKSLDSTVASLPFVEDHGFLNKNKPEEYAELQSLYGKADCFLLPTVAECAGIAFGEASAYGLPCFSHDTGGVGDYVIDGMNGHLLPLGSAGEDFGRMIKRCVESGEMETLSLGAVKVSRERLTWDNWASAFAEIIGKSLDRR